MTLDIFKSWQCPGFVYILVIMLHDQLFFDDDKSREEMRRSYNPIILSSQNVLCIVVVIINAPYTSVMNLLGGKYSERKRYTLLFYLQFIAFSTSSCVLVCTLNWWWMEWRYGEETLLLYSSDNFFTTDYIAHFGLLLHICGMRRWSSQGKSELVWLSTDSLLPLFLALH